MNAISAKFLEPRITGSVLGTAQPLLLPLLALGQHFMQRPAANDTVVTRMLP